MSFSILGLLSIGNTLLEGIDSAIDIITLRISDTDTHVSKADILGGNLLVQTAGENDAAFHEFGEDVRGSEALGQVNSRHAVCLVFGLGGELLEAHVCDCFLDLLGGFVVGGEAIGEGFGGDLREGGVEGVDELGGWSGEIGWLLGFVVLHDWEGG